MKKIDELVKRVEYFERLAVYGDRSTFLKRLAQEAPFSNPKAPTSFEGDLESPVPPPAPSGVMKMPEGDPKDRITGYRPIDKNIQNMLNVILDDQISPLFPDGQLGPQTKAALALFKKQTGKPASVAAITQAYNEAKGSSAVAKNPGAPMPAGKSNFPSGNTQNSHIGETAGQETFVPGPKA